MVVHLSIPQSSDNSFKTVAATHSPEWASSAAYAQTLSAQRTLVHPAPDSTRFPLLNDNSGNSITQTLLTPAGGACGNEGKEDQRREQDSTALLGTPRQTDFASFERLQKPPSALKHFPRPPGVARSQNEKSLRVNPAAQLTCRWRKLSSRCLRTKPGLNPVITRLSSFVSSDDCSLPRFAPLDSTGGRAQHACLKLGESGTGEQRSQDQTPQGFVCGASQLFRAHRARNSDLISIKYNPDSICWQESLVSDWFLSVIDKDYDSVQDSGIATEPTAGNSIERPGNYSVTNERYQTKDPDVKDAKRAPAQDDVEKQGLLAHTRPAASLSKRKLSPSVLLNPVSQRSFKNQRSLEINKETRAIDQSGIDQSGGGIGERRPSLDVEKTAMINRWLTDVSVKTADLKRGF